MSDEEDEKDEAKREVCFQEWAREIDLIGPEGTLNVEQALKELRDYYFMLGQVPKVYHHVSGGMLSYPNYYANAVIGVADEHMQKEIERCIAEEKEEWEALQEDKLVDARTEARNTTLNECIKIAQEITDKPVRRDSKPKSLQILRALEKLLKS